MLAVWPPTLREYSLLTQLLVSDLLTSDNAAAVRAQTIVEKLLHTGTVAVDELAAQFGVSVATVRRDLMELEQRGRLRRTHGGAVPR